MDKETEILFTLERIEKINDRIRIFIKRILIMQFIIFVVIPIMTWFGVAIFMHGIINDYNGILDRLEVLEREEY